MQYFINEIIENDDIKNLLLTQTKYYDDAKRIADSIIKTLKKPKLDDGIFPVFVLAFLADYALEINTKRGIDKDITTATLKDINIWIDNYFVQYGELGLGQFDWLFYHYTGDLFRLGRLQFRLEKAHAGIPEGEYAIETHIAQGEPLDIEECNKSFRRAEKFFLKYFQEYEPKYFMCHSWLVNPNLTELLNEDSNIVKFMRFWTPIEGEGDNSKQAIERVFGLGFKIEDIQNAPENTSLQRKLKEYIIGGGNLDITYGYKKK